MARIRSIKPEFWGDELLCSMPAMTRLAYIALWNEADDEGRLRAHPAYLRSRLFPYEPDCDMSAILAPLVEHGRLVVYEADGQTYGYLAKFNEHQAISKPSPSRLPPPPGVLPERSRNAPGTLQEDSGSPPGALPESSRRAPGGKGREGKGKEWNGEEREERSGADAPAPPVVEVGLSEAVAAARATLQQASGVEYQPASFAKIDRAVRKGSVAQADLELVVRWAAGHEFWRTQPPSVLFRREKFAELLAQARAGPPRPAGPKQPSIPKVRSVEEALNL